MHFSLAPLVMLLLAAVVVVIVCRRLHIPAMLGYLVVGFLFGPGFLKLLPQGPATDFAAEIGIVFLMFSIGLEFSIAKLRAMKHLVLGLGGLQVAITLLVTWLALSLSGFGVVASFAVAGALAMSSTAIVSRLLQEKSELSQQHGQMVMGVLLMQDIAVVPLMIMLPALMGSEAGSLLPELLSAAVKMIVTLGLLLLAGNKLMGPWFRLVARGNSSELFMINVLLVTLGVAYLTGLVGLSLALGAFVAGMLISETEYRYQVEDDIRPFRDILLGFFFMSVGMRLDFSVIRDSWALILLLLGVLIVLKGGLIYALGRRMKYKAADNLKTALYLAQGGEFGFVILAVVAGSPNVLSPTLEQAAIGAILISMMSAPFLINAANFLSKKLVKNTWEEQSASMHQMLVETMSKTEHVLIIGFGRSGQSVSRILAGEDIPYYALDLDAERVATARAAGEPVSFGDAKRKEVLHAAGLKRAKIVLITIKNMNETKHILNTIIMLDPTASVIVRATRDDDVQTFNHLGADDVVSDAAEASLVLAAQAMLSTGQDHQHVYDIIQEIRQSRYRVLTDFFTGSDEETNKTHKLCRYAFTLPETAHAVGSTLENMPLNNLNIKLLSLRRRGHQMRFPEPTLQLHAGDTLILVGTRDKVHSFENWCLQGEW